MSDIAHWLADKPGVPAVVLTSEAGAERYRRDGWRVVGPFVDPAIHQGAVEALRDVLDTQPTPSRHIDRWAAIHKRARAIVGGAS